MWRHMNPIFQVADIDRAVDWYRDVLGLTPIWRWEDRTAGMSIGDLELYLDQTDHPSPSHVSVFVDDADAAYEQYRAAGAMFADGLETKPWGIRRFTVRDPDGNLIDVGHRLS
jgi:catechol 2,3-dioxygenase-like lactoylglutathione lyase family enzyme